jgi:hypothetical protein
VVGIRSNSNFLFALAIFQHSQQNYETAMKTMNKKIGETEIRSLKKVNRKKRGEQTECVSQ